MINDTITNPADQVAEGDRYYNGDGVEKDFTQAAAWYEKAAKQGYAQGEYFIGYCYYAGEGVPQDYVKAAEWYMKAAGQGHAKAQRKLGYCFYFAEGVKQDFYKAVEWFIKSAEQNDLFAQYMLGFCYYSGEGLEQDYKQAVYWFDKSAEQGESSSQFMLGFCYFNGYGVDRDYKQAILWYTKSAEQGFDRAQHYLGICYSKGEGTEKDVAKGIFWFTKAAEQGYADSCIELVEMYLDGNGVEPDYNKGNYWFREAAKTGTPRAMMKFGEWLLGEEDHKPVNKEEGLQWLEKAADEFMHDDTDVVWEAKWTLAEVFEYGKYNIKKDLDRAKKLYKELVDNGDECAAVYLELLNQEREDPVHSRGWQTKILVARTLINDFPEFDAVGSLYVREENYEDAEFTDEETKACLPVAERVMELAALAKSEGISAFAAQAEKEQDIYLKTALKMAADGIRADIFDEVIKVLFIKEKPQGAQLLSRFIIHRGIYLIIRGDFTLQKLKVLLASLYVPQLLLPKNNDHKYKMTFNYLLTHRELPRLYFEGLNEFYEKILPDPEMMQRFLFFAYNRCKYFALENRDIEPAFAEEQFSMYLYGIEGRQVLIINLPKCDVPPESYQIAIPMARQRAAYYACELSVNPITSEPCFIFGEWNAEQKHSNYGEIKNINDNGFAQMAVEIAYGKPLKDQPLDPSKMEFDTPALELYCEKCETTNFFYDDNKPPYHCDRCGSELEEGDD